MMIEKMVLAIAITFCLNVVHSLTQTHPRAQGIEIQPTPRHLISLLNDQLNP